MKSLEAPSRRWRQASATMLAIKILFLWSFVFSLVRSSCGGRMPSDRQKVRTATVWSCQQLTNGILQKQGHFELLEIVGNVTCVQEDWPSNSVIRVTKDLLITGQDQGAILDFGDAEGVIEIHNNARLVFDSISIMQDKKSLIPAEESPFHFPAPLVTTIVSGQVGFHNVFLGFRSCGESGISKLLDHTYWREYTSADDTLRVCNTVFVCGEGAEEVSDSPQESADYCANLFPDLHGGGLAERQQKAASVKAALSLAVALPISVFAILVVVTLLFRKHWWKGASGGPYKVPVSSPLATSVRSGAGEGHGPMTDSGCEEGSALPKTDDEQASDGGNEYTNFPADDGLTLDMEWILGMGSDGSKVYKGRYHGHIVAVRIMECAGNPEDALKTPREVKVNKRLSHKNVVKIIFSGAFFTGGADERNVTPASDSSSQNLAVPAPVPYSTFIVMEHCEVGSLQSGMQRGFFIENDDLGGSKLDARLMLLCMLDVACGMQHMHENSIIHSALHPKNVLLKLDKDDERGFFCKIGDFSMSRKLPSKAAYVNTNHLSDITLMPPETLQDGILSLKTDVYSFGIMLWTLMAQRAPYEGMMYKDIRVKVMAGSRPKIPPFVDERVANLMVQCWQHDPHKRPTFSKIVSVLEGLVGQYAPKVHAGLQHFLDPLESVDPTDANQEEVEDSNTHRYLKIRFDPSGALQEGDGDYLDRSHVLPPELCRTVWAESRSQETDVEQMRLHSIMATGARSGESVDSLGLHHIRRKSQAKAHEAFVRAVDEMIQQSRRSSEDSSLNEFLDVLRFHVRQQEDPPPEDLC